MPPDNVRSRKLLATFDFKSLFIEELGWNRHVARLDIIVDGRTFSLSAVSEKCGMVVFECNPGSDGRIPDYATRRKIERQVTKSAYEHLIIYLDGRKTSQVWEWVRREHGKPAVCREHTYQVGQPGDSLIQKLRELAVSLEEEECLTLPDVTGRARRAFDVERVTKKFYDQFKTEHASFLKFLEGIPDEEMERWYISVMLNRLMFIYFIQKKGFLDNDADYLKNKLAHCRHEIGKDRYYRDFLCPLFFEGFAKRNEERSEKSRNLLGEVPYLNGGIFMRHQVEQLYGKTIEIPDRAFEKLFEFFDAYHWHLDERPLKRDDEINPDVLGYIFEKYVNQKQMGAYYTKEDITGYISKNTVIPFLFDAAKEKCKVAFEGERSVWHLLQEDPDRYIYPGVSHGIVWDARQSPPKRLEVGYDLPPIITEGLDTKKEGLLERRKGWNKPAPEEYALPTEIWREVVARRKRYEEVREKLVSGKVKSINDLITYNLDIRQFAQDVIENSEGPELLSAFWRVIGDLTVLDPACGSGAFLFAALNILEPLYEACLDRMRFFLEEWGDNGRKNHPNYHKLFTDTLKRVEDHPNHRYFVFKSIIVNNLFGVDIIEEGVEICKLRLFLKLVAQIERVERIEPLPDIDFNIRAGNTLAGFVSLEEVKKTQEGTFGFGKSGVARIEEEAEIVDRAFRKFREMQTEQGLSPSEFSEAKETLRTRLKKLTNELDRFLASEYGINESTIPGKKKFEDAFQQWKKSHQPFHWFVEFYGILKAGGFDVIIGNPPYVVYAPDKVPYKIHPPTYQTFHAKNLYAYVFERSIILGRKVSQVGLIVQLTVLSAERLASLQDFLLKRGHLCAIPFPRRPESIFEGVEMPVAIILSSHSPSHLMSTARISRFYTEERPHALSALLLANHNIRRDDHRIAKIGTYVEVSIYEKVIAQRLSLLELTRKISEWLLYYQEACRYWVKAGVGMPFFRRNGKRIDPPHGRTIYLFSKEAACFIACLMNSSLFYWFYSAFSDCEHINDMLLRTFPVPNNWDAISWGKLYEQLEQDLTSNAKRKMITTKQGHNIEYDEIMALSSKPIIDEIDRILAKHYGFTDEELDFIINYDIKYRMGQVDSEDGAE
jgi:hypothetical protein